MTNVDEEVIDWVVSVVDGGGENVDVDVVNMTSGVELEGVEVGEKNGGVDVATVGVGARGVVVI
jgi:hypothetical protein